MRSLTTGILDFFAFQSSSKSVEACALHRELAAISEILQENPKIIELVAEDLKSLSKANTGNGRGSVFSVETLFRGILIVQMTGSSFREGSDMILLNYACNQFCKLPLNKETIGWSLLCKVNKAIQPETWDLINQVLASRKIADGTISEPDIQRTDTTAVETNIHYPTDSSLLWDIYRSLETRVKVLRRYAPKFFKVRFHSRKIKNLHLFITRYSKSKNKKRLRTVKRTRRLLLARIESTLKKVMRGCLDPRLSVTEIEAQTHLNWLKEHFPTMNQIIDVAKLRLMGKQVESSKKVFSLFEPHTELIIRGRAEKPIEWGHKVLITQAKGGFIIDCMVMEKCIPDAQLTEMVIQRHQDRFGRKVTDLAADKGFCPDKETYEELEEITNIQIPKRLQDLTSSMMKEAQKFRAGIEGCISTLKRAFRMSKCPFRTFKTFEGFVHSVIFCYNLRWCAMKT